LGNSIGNSRKKKKKKKKTKKKKKRKKKKKKKKKPGNQKDSTKAIHNLEVKIKQAYKEDAMASTIICINIKKGSSTLY